MHLKQSPSLSYCPGKSYLWSWGHLLTKRNKPGVVYGYHVYKERILLPQSSLMLSPCFANPKPRSAGTGKIFQFLPNTVEVKAFFFFTNSCKEIFNLLPLDLDWLFLVSWGESVVLSAGQTAYVSAIKHELRMSNQTCGATTQPIPTWSLVVSDPTSTSGQSRYLGLSCAIS